MWSASFGAYIWWGDKAIFHYHIWKIIPDEKNIRKLFLYHYLGKITEEWKKNTSGMAMLHLTKSGMESHQIPIPNLEEQSKIVQIFSALNDRISNLEKKLHQTQSLKKSLMQDLLTGKVRVSVN
jgi:type I restriction enzyme S subunit